MLLSSLNGHVRVVCPSYTEVRQSPQKDLFPVRELMTSQWSRTFAWEGTKTGPSDTSKASQPLTSLYPGDRKVTGAVTTPISGYKVYRAGRIPSLNRHQKGNLYTLQSFKDACTLFNTLRRLNKLKRTPSPIDFQIRLDYLTPKGIYQGHRYRSSQRRPNAIFHRSDPALTVTASTVLCLNRSLQTMYREEVMCRLMVGHWYCMLNEGRQKV
ncbi:hypothetical protein TNCV_2650031 [Trichonephila clavipes]|nr:hypothetical protein TNCV_2650031 [Trichonephila clavipes]